MQIITNEYINHKPVIFDSLNDHNFEWRIERITEQNYFCYVQVIQSFINEFGICNHIDKAKTIFDGTKETVFN